MRDHLVFRTFEKSTRLFVSPFIFIYGIMKPWQFQEAFSNTSLPTNQLEGMALMWAFFGYSYIVPIFVGIFECCGAVLLVFDRTKLLGALLLLPVLANIVLFNLVYQVMPIPTMNSIFFLAVVLFVMFVEKSGVRDAIGVLLVKSERIATKPGFSLKRVFLLVGCLILNLVLFSFCHSPLSGWLFALLYGN